MSTGAFLTGIDIETKPKEQKQEQKTQIIETQPKEQKPKKLEPLNAQPQKPLKTLPVQTTKASASTNNNTYKNTQKRGSVSGNPSKDNKLAPIKKDRQQVLSQTMYNSKSQQHLGENKLKSFKSVMDNVKDNKSNKKEKAPQFNQQTDSTQYLGKYKEKIVRDIENIYSQSEYKKVLDELVRLENKQFIQSEITRTESLINKQKRIYNNTHYDLMQKEKQYASLQKQIDNHRILLSQSNHMEEYNNAVQELEDIEEENEDLEFRCEALEHMVYDRKKTVFNENKRVRELYQENIRVIKEIIIVEEDLQKHGRDRKTREQGVEELKQLVEEYQKALKYENVVMGQHFEDQLEDELSEYEDKKALKQIFKHEARRKIEVERERQEYREQQNQKNKEEKKKEQDKINKEMQEIKNLYNQEIEKFQKLERATGINVDLVKNLNNKTDVQKLERILGKPLPPDYQKHPPKLEKNIYSLYKDSIQKDNKNMEQVFRKKFEEKIVQTKEKISELREQLEILKYGEKDNEIVQDPNLIETLEQKLITERDLTQEKENQLRRVEKVIDNICIVISRISYQLPFGKQSKDKNVKVLRKDLLDQISICGLQLEKMLAILSKKKDTIRIESVNTASDNKAPPEYLGLNNKIIKSIQQQNPKYNFFLEERLDQSLDSMNNFPVKYMGIQQYIYASDKLQERQIFDYDQSFEEKQDESRREEDLYFEEFRTEQKKKILEMDEEQ